MKRRQVVSAAILSFLALASSCTEATEQVVGRHTTALDASLFDEKVRNAEGVALVDFWASWCGPCRLIAPSVEELAEAYKGRVLVGKVDVDKEGALATEYQIRSIPALLVFRDGKEVDRIIGVVPKAQIESALKKQLTGAESP